jgi:microcystin-dependent protein
MSSIDLISTSKVTTAEKGLRPYWQSFITYLHNIGGKSKNTTSFTNNKIKDTKQITFTSGDNFILNGVKWPKVLEENKPLYVYAVDELRFGTSTSIPGFYFTGEVEVTIETTPPEGWILLNDGTIGNASSGATNRANADTEALYTLLWTNISNTYCPVSGGRGASAAVDFAAGKTIQLPLLRGRAIGIYGSGSGLTARSLGETAGAETHALTANQIASHTHTYTDAGSTSNTAYAAVDYFGGTDTVNTSYTGSGAAHNNMQPTTFLNAIIKL